MSSSEALMSLESVRKRTGARPDKDNRRPCMIVSNHRHEVSGMISSLSVHPCVRPEMGIATPPTPKNQMLLVRSQEVPTRAGRYLIEAAYLEVHGWMLAKRRAHSGNWGRVRWDSSVRPAASGDPNLGNVPAWYRQTLITSAYFR